MHVYVCPHCESVHSFTHGRVAFVQLQARDHVIHWVGGASRAIYLWQLPHLQASTWHLPHVTFVPGPSRISLSHKI